MLRSFVIALALLASSTLAHAQSRYLGSPEETKKFAESIVGYVAANNYPAALKELRQVSIIQSTDFDLFEAQFNSQHASLTRQIGTANGYEALRSDKLGSRMRREQFMIFHERSAQRWNFIF